jgi:hypothetical protein
MSRALSASALEPIDSHHAMAEGTIALRIRLNRSSDGDFAGPSSQMSHHVGKMAPRAGFEPATIRLLIVLCSHRACIGRRRAWIEPAKPGRGPRTPDGGR